tara:strand:- start:549 stop:791 length:243 start_codon:yes stop_codon:yes gene_type:complete
VKVNSSLFGSELQFNVGDLVSWAKIQKRFSGVIEEMFLKDQGGRQVLYARVFDFAEQKKHDVLALTLKKLHKTVVNQLEN